ncbi:ABC transporter ATP-binding protein [Streptomyces sp. IBSBF 2806]|uniref:ABC transporter ATP-binding protein n=1 Tax=Streptomyces sp. IBSBF 2806 TaxID=2903529 RepID=UPI003FA77FBF
MSSPEVKVCEASDSERRTPRHAVRTRRRYTTPETSPVGFAGAVRGMLAVLAKERLLVAVAVLLAVASIVLSVFGPKILGRATDLVFAGVVGRQLPEGLSKDQAVEALRQHGQGTFADMVASMPVVPGSGVDFAAVGTVLLWAALIYLAAAALALVQGRVTTLVVQRAVFRLRSDVEAKLMRLPLSYFDRQQRGELLSRATNDIDNVQQTLQQVLSQITSSVLMLGGVLAMMLWISWVMALVALVSVPATVIAARWISKKAQPHFATQWATTGRLNGHIEEMYTGHQLIQIFGQQEQTSATFAQANDALFAAAFKAQFLAVITEPVMMFIGNLNFVIVAVVGGLRVASGGLSLGEVQAFIQYSRQFSQPVTQIASVANLVQSGAASAQRVFELLNADEETPDPRPPERPDPVHGQISFEKVRFRYQADKPLIEDLSLVVRPGQTVAVVGPSGAGKTTLFNLLMRFYDVDEGRIALDGVETTAMSRAELRSHMGMVLQDTWLFRGTIAENIAYGADNATREEIVAAAVATHVDRFVRTLPDGYETLVDDDAANLSAGEKQLITIARAFLTQPAILLLDEATSAVDTRTEALVQQAMGRLRRGRTSFVIAHRLSTVRDADLIVVLDDGRIVEQGHHESLVAAGGLYAQMHASQFSESAAHAGPVGQ